MTAELRAAWRFFYAHAGYCVGRRAIVALRLAKAEAAGRADPSLVVEWCDDPEGWQDMDGTHFPAFGCSVLRRTECECCGAVKVEPTGSSLWGIDTDDGPYRRVVEAELLLDTLSTEGGAL